MTETQMDCLHRSMAWMNDPDQKPEDQPSSEAELRDWAKNMKGI